MNDIHKYRYAETLSIQWICCIIYCTCLYIYDHMLQLINNNGISFIIIVWYCMFTCVTPVGLLRSSQPAVPLKPMAPLVGCFYPKASRLVLGQQLDKQTLLVFRERQAFNFNISDEGSGIVFRFQYFWSKNPKVELIPTPRTTLHDSIQLSLIISVTFCHSALTGQRPH